MPILVCCEILLNMCFWNTVLDPGDSVILRQSQYSYERKESCSGSQEIVAIMFYFKYHW